MQPVLILAVLVIGALALRAIGEVVLALRAR
jgi:hypothetical protein